MQDNSTKDMWLMESVLSTWIMPFSQLWVSQNLGPMSWIRLGRNVTRYYWRVLGTVQEPNTAVYFEEAINGILCMLHIPLYFRGA